MATIFPGSIDNSITLPTLLDNITTINADSINILRNTIIVIENNIGTNAQGIYGNIAERLLNIETVLQEIINSGGGGGPIVPITFGGDLIGTTTKQIVVGLNNRPFSSANPISGQAIIWSGTQWQPTTIPSATNISLGLIQVARDLGNTASQPQVVGIRGFNIQNVSPVDKSVLIFDVSSNQYQIRPLTLDDLGSAFAINSFTGGSIVETGMSVVNPTFFNTFSSAPTSAFITNTDSISSPTVEISPFTGAVVSGTFTHNTINSSVIFTLTASNGSSTKSATQSILYQGRSFFGIGTAGATSCTASGNNAVLVGAIGTLSINGLFASIPGQSFGPVSPVGQKIYFLTPHTSTPHTFIDQFTFPFAFLPPSTFSFINQQGVSLSYDLYQSVNTLSTSFTILAVS